MGYWLTDWSVVNNDQDHGPLCQWQTTETFLTLHSLTHSLSLSLYYWVTQCVNGLLSVCVICRTLLCNSLCNVHIHGHSAEPQHRCCCPRENGILQHFVFHLLFCRCCLFQYRFFIDNVDVKKHSLLVGTVLCQEFIQSQPCLERLSLIHIWRCRRRG